MGANAHDAEAPVGVVSPDQVSGPGPIVARSPGQLAWRRLRGNWVAWISAVFILLLVLFALSAPLISRWTGHGPEFQDIAFGTNDEGRPVGFGENGYKLGSLDVNGHDMLVWLSYGARISLLIALISTVVSMVIAIAIGMLSGFYGGFVDTFFSRITDIIAAFPFFLFGISMALIFGSGRAWVIIVTIVVFGWFYTARIVRADILALKEREFIEAARMSGASDFRIMRQHLLPHLVPTMIVYGSLLIASAVLAEAAISFLGFGLQVDQPSWGSMISSALQGGSYLLAPRLMLMPGTLLFLTVLAFSLLGDALRDALDPRGGGIV